MLHEFIGKVPHGNSGVLFSLATHLRYKLTTLAGKQMEASGCPGTPKPALPTR
jgi:hypothetical protein